ncbi:MAG: hypothetical protein KAI43_10360 [Candidatus Aureabacteria bacterium]|nr:hypothetical protein [Candidatus Auribacterota bacterium]
MQAFIIMQIGNPDLDSIYQDLFIPALESSGFSREQIKRVDKHNKGELLKSEIINFINSSDIIIADLTNERQNCYLEVGYAMGTGKLSNLILASKEDHYPDSPNYKKGGPKIHFDLIGYDILFWDPSEIEKAKTDLIKRINYRFNVLREKDSINNLVKWDKEWFSQHQSYAIKQLKNFQIKGYFELKLSLFNSTMQLSSTELYDIAKRSEINIRGNCPIGVIYEREEFKPKPKKDSISAEIPILRDESEKKYQYDYWVLRKNGDFYVSKSYLENIIQPGCLFIQNRIRQIAEALLYAHRLYTNFHVATTSHIFVSIHHNGFKGLSLCNGIRDGVDIINRSTTENDVYYENVIPFELIENNIMDYVKEFAKPFFELFEYYEVPESLLEDVVKTFLAKIIS